MSRNYPERLVAFIDIMGLKDLLKQAKDNPELIKRLSKAATTLTKIADAKNHYTHPTLTTLSRQVTNFSDAIVISYLTECKDPESEYFGPTMFYALSSLALDISVLCMKLIEFDVVLRGGIAAGNVYHKGNTIIGQGLVDAYNLESRSAIYPRVVISDDVIKRLPPVEEEYRVKTLKEKQLVVDFDGLHCIDYIGSINRAFPGDSAGYLQKLEELVSINLSNQTDLNILAKYRWLNNYINHPDRLTRQ